MRQWIAITLVMLSLVGYAAMANVPPSQDPVRDNVSPKSLADQWQEQIDNTGVLVIPPGVHEIERPLSIDPSLVVAVSGSPRGYVIYNGEPGTGLFEMVPPKRGSAWQGRFTCVGLKANATNADGSVFKVAYPKANFDRMTFRDCDFTAFGYCIDCDDIGYTVTPEFTNMRTGGGGAIRFRAARYGVDAWHACSQIKLDGWRHLGGNRIGPAFDFLGVGGLTLENIIDEGHCALDKRLMRKWRGPICLRINNPRTPCYIKNFYLEPWGNYETQAPGCWLWEIRNDNASSTGKHGFVEAKALQCHVETPLAGVGRVVGGSPRNLAGSLVVYLVDEWQPSAESIEVTGKAYVRSVRTFGDYHARLWEHSKKIPHFEELRIWTHHKPGGPDVKERGDSRDVPGTIDWYPSTDAELN